MDLKTPKFDAALDAIFADLAPHTRTCHWQGKHPHCEGDFPIEVEDIEFLKMLRVPPPNFCPTCRRMRRYTHLSTLQLFRIPCQAPGHTEEIISIFPPECPFPVYDYEYFTSDDFDPFAYGREYTDGSPLDLLRDLRKQFPAPSFLNRDPSSINSEYSNGGRNVKNGYYVSACFGVSDAWYSHLVRNSQQIMDVARQSFCELVYESVAGERLYNVAYTYFSSSCTDSMFLFDCLSCSNCFGCTNLRNKQYYIWNKPHTKEEYEHFMASIRPLRRETITQHQAQFWKLVQQEPVNAARIVGSDNVVGVDIANSRDLYDVNATENSEHIRHADGGLSHKDSMDFLASGGNSHHIYGCTNIGSQSGNVRFSVSSKYISDSEFIFNCKSLTNCFMCFGLQSKSYCILNKQYEPDDYWPLVDRIKTEMLRRGEYADDVGFDFSAQAYTVSKAQAIFPLADDTVRALDGYVAAEPEPATTGLTLLSASDVPQTIAEVDESILKKAIVCAESGRPFRIQPSELAFYQQQGLPLPVFHPSVRIQRRQAIAPEGRHYTTSCANCGKRVSSMFDPTAYNNLYCPDCYRAVVI